MLKSFRTGAADPYKNKLLPSFWPMVAAITSTVVLLIAGAVDAAQPMRKNQNVIIVGNDRGGPVVARAEQIEHIRKSGQRVEIRGRQCLSSCTMYLGLADTCVNPNTIFGFHGPSQHGRALAKVDFDYWSQVIADHYPQNLQAWYMKTGRHRLHSYAKLNGRALIKLGIRQCV